jgi:hypothetical protein
MPGSIWSGSARWAKDFGTRQSVDTQKAFVAQYQPAVLRDQATIDNAKVQLGYDLVAAQWPDRCSFD